MSQQTSHTTHFKVRQLSIIKQNFRVSDVNRITIELNRTKVFVNVTQRAIVLNELYLILYRFLDFHKKFSWLLLYYCCVIVVSIVTRAPIGGWGVESATRLIAYGFFSWIFYVTCIVSSCTIKVYLYCILLYGQTSGTLVCRPTCMI